MDMGIWADRGDVSSRIENKVRGGWWCPALCRVVTGIRRGCEARRRDNVAGLCSLGIDNASRASCEALSPQAAVTVVDSSSQTRERNDHNANGSGG